MRVFTENPAKKEAPKGIPIRALLDVMDRIPEKKFGRGPSRRLRKLVLLGLAGQGHPHQAGLVRGVASAALIASQPRARSLLGFSPGANGLPQLLRAMPQSAMAHPGSAARAARNPAIAGPNSNE